MFDARLRPIIERPLDAVASRLARGGVHADTLTWLALVVGLGGATFVTCGAYSWGLALFAVNRVLDGLDGAVARRTALTDRGGFLDIVCDFLIYAAFPLAFAVADPDRNALAAACLLASFNASGCTFLAFAAIAAKRGLSSSAQGQKSIYYLAGLAEGFETIVAFGLMCLWPEWFAVFAYGFAAVCFVSAVARIVSAMRTLRHLA
jgi:phosphatidylglycerophosphate synthase